MSPIDLLAIVALIIFAVYRQSRPHELIGSGRFKLAIIYIVAGVVIGGLHPPQEWQGWVLLASSIALSLIVGLARGRYTDMWASDGGVYVKGNRLTIGLFVAMIVVKFAMGFGAYFLHITTHGGFGEVVVMIGVMVAVQAQYLWRRARPLNPRRTASSGGEGVASPAVKA